VPDSLKKDRTPLKVKHAPVKVALSVIDRLDEFFDRLKSTLILLFRE